MASGLDINFPHPTIPFSSPEGIITREWLYVILTLIARGGGAQGISSATLQGQISAILGESTMADVVFPAPPTSLPVLLSATLADDVPRPPLNPFLASMLVADAA